mgnify:CR=1 FL=1
MNILLKSIVEQDLESVYNRFDADLFVYLLPLGAKLIQFGGSKKGDIVHLKLPVAGEWVSLITEDGKTNDSYYFVDEGKKLPFPLKYWKHKHILTKLESRTIIEDNMTFSTGYSFLDLLFYPVLYLSFLPRTWQYKSYFKS